MRTYEEVKNYLLSLNIQLLSTSYKRCDEKLDIKCKCGNLVSRTFNSILQSSNCRFCAGTKKYTIEYISNYCDKYNCTLIQYTGCLDKLIIKCSCGIIYEYFNFKNFRNSKYKKCLKCTYDIRAKNQIGSKNHQWIKDRKEAKLRKEIRSRYHSLVISLYKSIGKVKDNLCEKILGYSRLDLRNKILNHKNWKEIEDKKLDWDIDHIFPMKAFIDYGITDARIINSLDNLQPLSKKDNLFKASKYNKKDFEDYLISKNIKFKSQL